MQFPGARVKGTGHSSDQNLSGQAGSIRKLIISFRFPLLGLGFMAYWVVVTLQFHHPAPRFNPEVASRYQELPVQFVNPIQFCGEEIPVANRVVQRRLNRELRYMRAFSSGIKTLYSRSGRWFPVIVPILKQQGIPTDFKYVVAVESAFEQKVSRRGAAGFWQLMPPAATKHGLRMDAEVDERFHVRKATLAASKHIKMLYRQFGTWSAALAAYNIGDGALQRHMNAQDADTYYELRLNQETARYVFRLVAMKLLFTEGDTYGVSLSGVGKLGPLAVRNVKVKRSINDLNRFAINHRVSLQTLRMANPWLRGNSLRVNPGQTLIIEVPKAGQFVLSEDQIANRLDSLFQNKEDSVTLDEKPLMTP